MRKKAAARFCGDCGYEFARDDHGECRMCARFEQLRDESALRRPKEPAHRPAHSGEAIDSGPVPSADWPPTPAEYRAILAARRRSTASPEGQSRGPAATVIGTPALPQPANSGAEETATPIAKDSPRPPKKRSTARRNSRPPTVALPDESATPPKSKVRRKSPASAPTLPSNAPTPILIRLRAAPQPAGTRIEARTAQLAGESPPPAEKFQAGRKSRSTLPPSRDGAPSFPAAVKETAAPAAPLAHRVPRAQATGQHASTSDRGYPWKTAMWVAVGGGLFAASVALLSSLIR